MTVRHAPLPLSQDSRGIWTARCTCGQWEQRRPSKADAEVALKAHLARVGYGQGKAQAEQQARTEIRRRLL